MKLPLQAPAVVRISHAGLVHRAALPNGAGTGVEPAACKVIGHCGTDGRKPCKAPYVLSTCSTANTCQCCAPTDKPYDKGGGGQWVCK